MKPTLTTATPRLRPSRWLKTQILETQEHRCLGCQRKLESVEFDHIIPLALGGLNSSDNWAALCAPCHRTKTVQDLKRIAKAKRQRRFHEFGKGRAISAFHPFGKKHRSSFDKTKRRHLNGVVTPVANTTREGD